MSNAARISASQSRVFKFRSCVRLAFVTSVTCTPPFGPPVKFHRRKVSIFPKSSSPPIAFSRAPGTFSSSQCSFRLLKYVLSGNPVFGRKRIAAEHRSEEHTSELQSLRHLVCRLLLEKKKKRYTNQCDSTRSHLDIR